MNRSDGFPIADLDVGLFHDAKVLALARRLKDERATAATLALYVNLVLESWAAGDRITLDEGVPAWWMTEIDAIRADLQAVGLIDDESRVSIDAWTSWFVVAFDRREKRRESGAEGGRRSWESRRDKRRRSDASSMPNPSVLPSGRSSLQTGRPEVTRARVTAAPPCALCGRAVSADNTTVREVGGKWSQAHRVCPVAVSA